MSLIMRATRELTTALGRQPASEEIAERLSITVERVRFILDVVREPLSLEMPIGADEKATLEDFLEDTRVASPAESLYENDLATSMRSALGGLTDREARILRMRFGIGQPNDHTLEEIGQAFGLTRERIRQIEEKALSKLRRSRAAGQLRPLLES
jgi:RNA polymerase primary sigma factor